MDRSSEFIKNKGLFGGYPTQEHVTEYENMGIRFFIDLTFDGEKHITPYTTKYTYINYPIHDRRIPTDWKQFATFIIKIGNIIESLKQYEKIYIHCKGGHGRSGIVVACLLCHLYKISPSEAIEKTTKYHNRRPVMKEKWRRLGSPQTRSQKHFVSKFFEPLYIYKNYTKYFSTDFSNTADLTVIIPGFGMFPNADSAFNAFRDPLNDKYVGSLETATDDNEINKIISECKPRNDWDEVKKCIMYTILQHKFGQHTDIYNNLIQTGLRPIIVQSNDLYWGKNDNCGKNVMGKLISKLRKEFYLNQ